MTDLDGQRVGVAVRGDGKEPVGAAVAATPDLGPLAPGRAQDVSPASANARGATADGRRLAPSAGGLPQERAHHTRGRPGTTRAGSERRTEPEQDHHGIGVGVVEDERPALVAVSCRGGRPHVEQAAAASRDARRAGASRFVQRGPRGLRFHDGHQPQLGDEAVVVGGELAVDPLGNVLAASARSSSREASRPTRRSRRTMGRRTRPPVGHGLGDDVVVRRRPAAPERRRGTPGATRSGAGPAGCPRRGLRRPASHRATGAPTPSRQPDAELDPARPVNAGQEGVARPPGAEWAATRSAYLASPVSHHAAASTVRWWWRRAPRPT